MLSPVFSSFDISISVIYRAFNIMKINPASLQFVYFQFMKSRVKPKNVRRFIVQEPILGVGTTVGFFSENGKYCLNGSGQWYFKTN